MSDYVHTSISAYNCPDCMAAALAEKNVFSKCFRSANEGLALPILPSQDNSPAGSSFWPPRVGNTRNNPPVNKSNALTLRPAFFAANNNNVGLQGQCAPQPAQNAYSTPHAYNTQQGYGTHPTHTAPRHHQPQHQDTSRASNFAQMITENVTSFTQAGNHWWRQPPNTK